MANILKMDLINTIVTLSGQGWSKRRIARELRVDRQTVRRYLAEHSKSPPISIPGPEGAPVGNHPFTIPGSQADAKADNPVSSLCDLAVNQAVERSYGKAGRPSKCNPHTAFIKTKVHEGLTAQRIYQDLVCECQFDGSYQAVKRFIRRFKAAAPIPIYRIEVQPAEEAQVDFGTGAWVVEPEGRRRRPWIFRIILSYSRIGYSEAVW